MSTAEVVAYLTGTAWAGEHRADLDAGTLVVFEPPDPVPDDVAAALERLGPQGFGYWMLRGVKDALGA